MAKVDEFGALLDGDLGYGSKPIAADVLVHFRDLGYLPLGRHAVPTFDGAVAIEWREAGVEYTAQIQPGNRLFLCADNVVTDQLDETEIDFNADVLHKFLACGAWDFA